MANSGRELAWLIGSVLDGTPVDWDAAESSADEAGQRRVRQLRVVADIARVHQAAASGPASVRPPSSEPLTTDRREGVAEWGPLRLLERTGDGPFGEVYRAWDTRLDREVALRLRREGADECVSTSTPIVEEGRLLARVRHPNVVSVYGAERFDDRVGVWMEFVRGRSLARIIEEDGVFGAHEATLVGMALCKALSAMYRAGLLHRDVRAHNVIREEGGRIVLMSSDAHAATMAAGGPASAHLAPELLAGGPASVRSEVYSLGALLHLLVTGTLPVVAGAPKLLGLQTGAASPSLRDARSDLPDGFLRVVERALASDPAARYDSFGAMEHALAASIDVARDGLAMEHSSRAGPTQVLRRRVIVLSLVTIALVLSSYAIWRAYLSPSDAVTGQVRLAVLPFQNLSGDPAQDYFSEGLTEEMITYVGRLNPQRLSVIARTSVLPYRRRTKTAAGIGRELRVNYLLEGSVRRSGDRVRITAQLVDTTAQTQLWADSFERDLREVLALQRDLAHRVAGALSIKLLADPDVSMRASKGRPVDPEVYELYLNGRFFWNMRTELGRARTYFERAIARDPTFAPAYAGLGDLMGARDFVEAEGLARKALALDDGLAEAHSTLAHALSHQFAWTEAGREFQRAIDLDPSYPPTRYYYAEWFVARGNFGPAIQQARLAVEADPISAISQHGLGGTLYYARQYAQAEAQFRRALELDPAHFWSRLRLANVYVAQGLYDRAIAELNQISQPGLELGYAYAAAGRGEEARRVLSQEPDDGRAGAVARARIHGALGEVDEAIRRLNIAFEHHAYDIVYLKVDPRLDPLRRDARFAELLRRARLAP
jgi:TolB-like protein/thioredoxin-like negative regulator of GroEL